MKKCDDETETKVIKNFSSKVLISFNKLKQANKASTLH